MSSPTIQPAARSTLVTLAEEHLTQLIREAVCVQRHCKRARIHVHGDGDQPGVVKRRLHAEDINMALQWRSSEKIYATGTIGSSSSDDKKVNLQDYLKSEMDLRPPHEVGLTMHWLAVDGIQPDIPQNPTQEESISTANRVEQDEEPNGVGSGSGGVHVTQLLPRLLSEELQLYFTRITTAVERGGKNPTARKQQDGALAGIAKDSGLQELVPFLVRYVAESLNKNLGNPEHCRTLVRMARSLLVNPHLHLELHLHQLLPALLTCVVAERLASKAWENHWILRSEAASAVVQACNQYGKDYSTLKARVLGTLCEAAGPDRSIGTQYGGFVGITLFGPNAINAFLLPLAVEYWGQWEEKLEFEKNPEKRLELQMCQQAVLTALGTYLRNDKSHTPENLQVGWEELEDIFGDRLVMRSNEETEYAMCTI